VEVRVEIQLREVPQPLPPLLEVEPPAEQGGPRPAVTLAQPERPEAAGPLRSSDTPHRAIEAFLRKPGRSKDDRCSGMFECRGDGPGGNRDRARVRRAFWVSNGEIIINGKRYERYLCVLKDPFSIPPEAEL